MKPADIDFMRLALAEAEQGALQGEVPVGAVLVLDGKIVGRGFNQPIGRHDPSAHAEMVAIRQAAEALGNYRIPGSTLYVTLEPCTMCAGLLVHSRIARLVFGASEPRAGAVVSRAQVLDQSWMNHRMQVEGGVLAEECGALLAGFFRERRR
jgi:tRNA(adenine34) deaminase